MKTTLSNLVAGVSGVALLQRPFRVVAVASIIAFIGTMAYAQQEDTTQPASSAPGKSNGTNTVRLNFRGVPLEMVLNHLAEATDLIINVVPGTEVKGKVDVWSNHPLTRDEAVDLLNTILNQNGLAAIHNNRMLTIVSRDDAKTKDIPVKAGNKPDAIPKSDQMVTQIIPVQHANAVQLVQNLQPLLATYATLTANESGNALVLTSTQSDARRIAEIVQALDTSISSVSAIRVFPLKYADATELATAVKQLFEPPTQNNNNDRRTQFLNRFFPGGGPGGGPDGGRGGDGGRRNTGTSPTGNPAAPRVIAVADERSNSLVVSAPDELIPTIEQLVSEVDVSVSDLTELRVFHLKNADPLELADIFGELFPDESTTSNNNQGEFRFRGPQGFPFGGNNNRNNNQSESQRMKRKGRVIAVPDQRTSSLIVSAASELMPQIEQMITQLDASGAKKQKVFVYSLENADVQQVQEIVRDMFDRGSMSGNRNNANQNSALQNRSQQNQQNMGIGGNGNTGFGNGQGRTGGGNQGGQFR
jgi:type II secretory pathway component GspD/PulD (secretin)